MFPLGGPIMTAVCHECGAVLESTATKHTILGPDGCLDHLKAELASMKDWQKFAREQMSDAALREVDRRYNAREDGES